MPDHIRFLGTAGSRWVVAKQARASGGIYLNLLGKQLLLDPGPGCLVRCTQADPPIELSHIDGLIVTHGHIDHCNDINIVVDSMTGGGIRRRGVLFCPEYIIEGDDAILLKYFRRFLNDIVILEPCGRYELDGVRFATSIPHDHGLPTYGISFDLGNRKLGFLLDTLFFPELLDSYSGIDVLVVFVTFHERPGPRIYHLCIDDVKTIGKGAKPRKIILTHFGTSLLEAGPERVAAKLSDDLGIEVIAATDGMVVEV